MSPVFLSGAVMTHPRRIEAARALAAADPQGRIRVVADPDPTGPPTALRVADPSWSCVAPEATHHLVLQDDVLLAAGFFEHLEQAAAAAPGEAVACYEGWDGRNSGVVRLGALLGAAWAYAIDEHVPSLALLLPAEAARGYQEFAAAHGDGWPYDVVIQRYLKHLGIPVRIAVPSTADHDDLPSIAGNSSHGWRCATYFTEQAARATPAGPADCADFSVVPFYQYGWARCAVRHDSGWEYLETERYLRRAGVLDACLAAFDAAARPDLPAEVCREVWLTGFATGLVLAGLTKEDPAPEVAAAVMESLGPGGLCEEYTRAELLPMIPPIRDLALAALAAGRATESTGRPPAPATVAVSGRPGYAAQLTGLLSDLGHQAAPLGTPGPTTLIHLGDPLARPVAEVLAAARQSGVRRLVYAGSTAVYRGAPDSAEDSLTACPQDGTAAAWWSEEQACLAWGRAQGVPVQIVRFAEPVGPHAPLEGALATWMHRAWTRLPLPVAAGPRTHQLTDYRDQAGALAAVLAHPAGPAVLNAASATRTEQELAELVAQVARRTPWEATAAPAPHTPPVSTARITADLGWTPSADLVQGARALAQWLACDTHDTPTDPFGGPAR
ncbi:NAD(P)-dependent oxidoreductase [Kitasatospora sp. NPDC002227]|uniref:NAD-dependent epimerase/dehydratase family protein n=1 Tax=Kitasatospora sp. NPDC002227 TaxID=3154773 RepID=UPI00332A2AD7